MIICNSIKSNIIDKSFENYEPDGTWARWWGLIVTMDDATSEHYSMFFVEEGTASSFRGVRDVIAARGPFSPFYSDRGSHYRHTPEADGKVSRRISPGLAEP